MDAYRSLFDLTGKKAVVTGACGGIGSEIACGLAAFGAEVLVAGHKLAKALATVERVGRIGGKATPFELEITDAASVADMVAVALGRMKRIDILINSAGINIRQPVVEIDEESWSRVLDVNLRGVLLCCQAVAPGMIQQNSGRIVNIASVSSKLAHLNRAAYAASKGALVQVTKTMANEWGRYSINVNAISPAAVDTPFIAELRKTKWLLEREMQKIPVGRIAVPMDIVGAAVFLSSEASSFITGHNLFVDGGRTVD